MCVPGTVLGTSCKLADKEPAALRGGCSRLMLLHRDQQSPKGETISLGTTGHLASCGAGTLQADPVGTGAWSTRRYVLGSGGAWCVGANASESLECGLRHRPCPLFAFQSCARDTAPWTRCPPC